MTIYCAGCMMRIHRCHVVAFPNSSPFLPSRFQFVSFLSISLDNFPPDCPSTEPPTPTIVMCRELTQTELQQQQDRVFGSILCASVCSRRIISTPLYNPSVFRTCLRTLSIETRTTRASLTSSRSFSRLLAA